LIIRVGHGFDAHRLESDRALIIGGVSIPYERGLAGHSDADVLIHALSDALLGAAGLGDIGQHFPGHDQAYAGRDSREFLRVVVGLLDKAGYRPVNVDCTIIAEVPRMAPFLPEIRLILASLLLISPGGINVKATTTDGMGYAGRGEGIAAHAVVLISDAHVE
jgi:2-C-methyl-D-erythritol 2,4-cyclodiphosphate synthase